MLYLFERVEGSEGYHNPEVVSAVMKATSLREAWDMLTYVIQTHYYDWFKYEDWKVSSGIQTAGGSHIVCVNTNEIIGG